MNKLPVNQAFRPIKHLMVFTFMLLSISVFSQTFSGFNAFKKLIEFEGQRYLMSNIYEITSTDFDHLRIEKTIDESDESEGFMIVFTSYEFNGKSGVVISAYSSRNFANTDYSFTNIHLTTEEYKALTDLALSMVSLPTSSDDQVLRRFNDRIILSVDKNSGGFIHITLWIDNMSRHSFLDSKWDKAYRRHMKFVNE